MPACTCSNTRGDALSVIPESGNPASFSRTTLGPRFRGDDGNCGVIAAISLLVIPAIYTSSFPRKRESSVVGLRRSNADERHWVPAFAGTTRVLGQPFPIRHSREGGNPCCDRQVQ